jgi:hypothetical protein
LWGQEILKGSGSIREGVPSETSTNQVWWGKIHEGPGFGLSIALMGKWGNQDEHHRSQIHSALGFTASGSTPGLVPGPSRPAGFPLQIMPAHYRNYRTRVHSGLALSRAAMAMGSRTLRLDCTRKPYHQPARLARAAVPFLRCSGPLCLCVSLLSCSPILLRSFLF